MLERVSATAGISAPALAGTPFLRIRNLVKTFGSFTALNDVSLDIYKGELVCFLGPSGCGKTTLLRAIAGLDVQTAGTIEIGGRDVSRLAPSQRDFGIVFQSYALFPNLTIARNVGYGLVNKRQSRADIAKRVAELLALVGLPEQGTKYPGQLSGGQQQRVALARALATSPSILLLDEPLSALDARVRVRLRDEIRALQRRLGVTTIMVTHDQEEALTMADRIVVMNHGVIEQVGTPLEIYRDPKTAFVADFVGTMTFIDAEVAGPGQVRIGEIALAANGIENASVGSRVRLGFRPEDVRVRDLPADAVNRFDTRIDRLSFLGSFCRAVLQPQGGNGKAIVADFSANLMRDRGLAEGQTLPVALPPASIHVYAAPDARPR